MLLHQIDCQAVMRVKLYCLAWTGNRTIIEEARLMQKHLGHLSYSIANMEYNG